MKNQIAYASAMGSVVVRLAQTQQACEEACKIHHTVGAASDALCRVITGAVLGASLMKNDDDLFTLTVNGNGAITHVTATASPTGTVKGLIDFDPEALQPTVSASIGDGMMRIMKESRFGEPYSGSIELISGEIAEDLTAYYAYSEQTPSSCALGEEVDADTVSCAGGFLIQLMPDTTDETIDLLESDLAHSQSVCELFDLYNNPEELLKKLLPGLDPTMSETKDIRFECSCSHEKAEQALISSGAENLKEMIAEDHDFPVVCPYCLKEYRFTSDELKDLLKESSEKAPKAEEEAPAQEARE